jgi:hypothetical protein
MLDVNDGGIADDAARLLELTALSNFAQRLSFESTGVKRVT